MAFTVAGEENGMHVGRSHRGVPQSSQRAALEEAQHLCTAIDGIGFTAERSQPSRAGFMTIAPCGLEYWPPCASLEEARQEIRDRSIREDEPGWKILELDENGDAVGEALDAIAAFRRMDSAEDSSQEAK